MINKILLIMFMLSACLILNPVPVRAFDLFPSEAVDCSQAKESKSTVCKTPNTNPISGPDGILIKITTIVAYIGGVAAIIMIIVSGINFMTSNGDSAKVQSARRTLTNAMIGLAVIILAKAIVTYVVVRL